MSAGIVSRDAGTVSAGVAAPGAAGGAATSGAGVARVTGVPGARDVAREQGAVAALVALAAVLPVAVLPGECVLLPDDVAPPPGSALLGEVLSDAGPLLAWRAAASGPVDDRRDRAADAAWRVGVAWARTGLCERLADRAVDRLRGRSIGGTATVNLPPVRLVLADAALAHLEAQALLARVTAEPEERADDRPVPATTLARVTAVLDRTSRTVHNLFGASGFVDGDAARLARTIDLLGHASGTLPTGATRGGEGQDA
ncbi:Acyl-CoA dehydrogenase, C-terminal domain [Cellulosimicrobium aquatile]|uniref:Acyl-CoA dehydrogenase, C-terminal domain n=1 Tax=Cellulosimicrobium aquatile TaxID=1612203 RepID=A0A1N6WAJ1_9MICO|nr:acyl-CoA dehydrogenase family protein [Cellulosimicrobium aquatile]SIQ87161.1 Acyl-CoA dehydrogenase, C-terminal domain [Cellulosimicrobium aquatile]